MYDYVTPPGLGDQSYQYVFNASALTDGSNYQRQFIPVDNYDFIMRMVSGMDTVVGTSSGSGVQFYDSINRQFFSLTPNWGNFASGFTCLPEKRYPVNSRIAFDLYNVLRKTPGASVYCSQLVFSGVRRVPGAQSDPQRGTYDNYYLKPYSYQYINPATQTPGLVISSLATGATPVQQNFIEIKDFDFELCRIEMTPYTANSPFSVTLYDTNLIARSNLPVNANRFFHFNPASSSGEMNFWPTPPLLYKVDSRIRFDTTSLLTAGAPATYQLHFVGNRRIPCK